MVVGSPPIFQPFGAPFFKPKSKNKNRKFFEITFLPYQNFLLVLCREAHHIDTDTQDSSLYFNLCLLIRYQFCSGYGGWSLLPAWGSNLPDFHYNPQPCPPILRIPRNCKACRAFLGRITNTTQTYTGHADRSSSQDCKQAYTGTTMIFPSYIRTHDGRH
jgi:hypothetical protein